MVQRTREGQIIETAMEARQAEPGPSMLAVLMLSAGGAMILLATIAYLMF